MVSVTRYARPGHLARRALRIPRPGRRAISLTLGLAILLLLVDAVVHPRTFVDLWTIQMIQRLDGWGLLGHVTSVKGVAIFAGAIALPISFVLRQLFGQSLVLAIRGEAVLGASKHRRNLAALLTEYWYGTPRVARVSDVTRKDAELGLLTERVAGRAPADPYVARAFLAGLAARFEEAGLPAREVDPRRPRAIDGVIETEPGVYSVVDLAIESVDFGMIRSYIAREEPKMRAVLGDGWIDELRDTLAAAEREAMAWRRSESGIWRGFRASVPIADGWETARKRLAEEGSPVQTESSPDAARSETRFGSRGSHLRPVAKPTPFHRRPPISPSRAA
jgi:hypothetical protein